MSYRFDPKQRPYVETALAPYRVSRLSRVLAWYRKGAR